MIRVATLDLGGIQPVTKAMAEAAGGTLRDKPSDGEIEIFRKRGTNFQLISLVLSCVAGDEVEGVLQVRPFAMTLIMNDGATFSSWYYLWNDLEFRHTDGLVTEADLFFPDERVAVFCDGGFHLRPKQIAKDAAIAEKLAALGIRSVRISGDEIRSDLPNAVGRVKEVLGQQ